MKPIVEYVLLLILGIILLALAYHWLGVLLLAVLKNVKGVM